MLYYESNKPTKVDLDVGIQSRVEQRRLKERRAGWRWREGRRMGGTDRVKEWKFDEIKWLQDLYHMVHWSVRIALFFKVLLFSPKSPIPLSSYTVWYGEIGMIQYAAVLFFCEHLLLLDIFSIKCYQKLQIFQNIFMAKSTLFPVYPIKYNQWKNFILQKIPFLLIQYHNSLFRI